jgi:23S rRNA pseudouridine1911/1915/1917 synthase
MPVNVRLVVPESRDGSRLDRFLLDSLPEIPPRSIRRALAAGDARIDGCRAAAGTPIHAGGEIVVSQLAEMADWAPVPCDLPGASVLHSDGSVAVLLKPEGVPTVPVGIRESGTLAGYFMRMFPEAASWCRPGCDPLLSRLDNDTSGVVLAATSAAAHRFLLEERKGGRLRKRYAARVSGEIDRSLVIRSAIETRGGGEVRVGKGSDECDRNFWTRIVPLSFDGRSTTVAAEIIKGKRHQIRAHLASIGFPIEGDAIYGSGGPGRLMLHAAEITFTHPERLATMRVEAPLPPGFGIQRLPESEDSSCLSLSRSPGNSD